jgi:hypothetical protein
MHLHGRFQRSFTSNYTQHINAPKRLYGIRKKILHYKIEMINRLLIGRMESIKGKTNSS